MSSGKEDFLYEARNRFRSAISAFSETRKNELEDLKFLAGSPDNKWQWPSDVVNSRSVNEGITARPCLTINKLPQHVKEITNDQRQNRPSGKVIPVNNEADLRIAEIFDGLIRHIEYISDADVAYDTACENQVIFGEGYWRILTEYIDDTGFEQEIKIGRIRNSFSVYMDPMIEDPCGADAEWCFIVQEMTKKEYERLYPNSTPISSIEQRGIGDQSLSNWISEDTVRVAEYFYTEYKRRTLNMYPGGNTSFEGDDQDKEYKKVYGEPRKTRSVQVRTIKWCKINGFDILEEGEWAGKYIPVIRVIGNEYEVDGKVYLSGIIRNAKDAQRMYNYWVSQEAEMLALAPKAPFIGYHGQFEGFEDKWKTANTIPYPYLEVNAVVSDANGAVLPLPQRAMPPMAQTGLIQAKMGAADDIKSVTGQYDASLGATSNERSGKAILARERQTDTGTYHYVDNLARAVRYTARQIIDLVPKIYDTQRIARIVGEDGDVKAVKMNPDQEEAVKEIRHPQTGDVIEKIFNLNVGKYDVCVTTGPNYLTKRQEALESMTQILQANPQLWSVMGDLVARNMDWPGSEEMAKRLAKTIDPKLLNDEQSPQEAVAQQQVQQLQQQVDQLHQMLNSVQHSFEAQEAQRRDEEVKIKAYDAETKRIAQIAPVMNEQQIQDIVLGTIHGLLSSQDISGQEEQQEQMMPEQGQPQPQMGQPMQNVANVQQPMVQ